VTPAGTTRLSAHARREQLLDAAKEVVARGGFHAVSIEAVAREAGVSRPIVYGHFDDLPGLLEALVERESARAQAQLAELLPRNLGSRDARDILVGALCSYLRAVAEDPGTWRLVLLPPESAPPLLREEVERGRGAVVAELAEAIRPGLGPGLEPPDPEMTALTLSTLADESARLLLTDRRRYPAERILAHAEWLLDQLLSR
jgi:AcrR family transcriptional regulator